MSSVMRQAQEDGVVDTTNIRTELERIKAEVHRRVEHAKRLQEQGETVVASSHERMRHSERKMRWQMSQNQEKTENERTRP